MSKLPKDRAPSMQFYFRQFSGDERVMAMDLDTVGAHILLMCAAGASSHGHKLLSDECMIRNIIRNPSDTRWERIKSQLLRGAWKISADGKWWTQTGLRRSFNKAKVFRKMQREKGKQGAEVRWHDGRGHDSATTSAISKNSSSSLSSSSKEQSQNLKAVPVCGNVEKQLRDADKQIAEAQKELRENPESRGARLAFDEGTGQRRRIQTLVAPICAKKAL